MSEKETPLTEAFFYILLALRKPNHGYGVIQEIEQLTGGRVVLGPGTLYGALQTMQKREWIRIYSQDIESRKKKEYIITDLGRAAFEAEQSRLEELLSNAKLMEEGEA
ncbi:MAG: helix-turn-helix transcriptional regulator [Lachnospiraceae bacterium]|nr:helix-turn-helix transcriptional regulator [Lachnospiraceae bacterium]